jgi:hypothetical protein
MQVDTARTRAKRFAAKLPNGAAMVQMLTLDHIDGRTLAARRARELIEALETDLGGGDRLTEGYRQLIKRAAVLGTYIESCEAMWLSGQNVDLPSYMSAVNVQRRVLATIGLERRQRDITPTPLDYANGAAE